MYYGKTELENPDQIMMRCGPWWPVESHDRTFLWIHPGYIYFNFCSIREVVPKTYIIKTFEVSRNIYKIGNSGIL